MGCDIHLVLEFKPHGTDEWVGRHAFDTFVIGRDANGRFNRAWSLAGSRNYGRFAALAGVRGEGPPAVGLPDDASSLTKVLAKQWGGDAHSHSWLPIKKAIEVFLATEPDPAEVFLKEGDPRARFPMEYFFGVYDEELNDADFRLVFWFDN